MANDSDNPYLTPTKGAAYNPLPKNESSSILKLYPPFQTDKRNNRTIHQVAS